MYSKSKQIDSKTHTTDNTTSSLTITPNCLCQKQTKINKFIINVSNAAVKPNQLKSTQQQHIQ